MTATKVFVAGASGEVGTEVIRSLRARGVTVRALVRTQRIAGVEEVVGDLMDRASLDRAVHGCEAAIFITPHHPNEERMGHNVLDACVAAPKIQRVVYISAAHPLSRSRVVQRLFDGLIGLVGAHYKSKLRVERRLRATPSLSPVALCPTNFYQNDELCLPEILAGHYPQPLGRRAANRVDTRDIGDAAAIAVTTDLASGAYPLVGPDGWTGARCADVWTDALGMPVTYAGDDLARWAATVGARMPPERMHDFAKTYGVIQRFGIPVTARSIAKTEQLLGRPARDYRSYVQERVAQLSWRAAG